MPKLCYVPRKFNDASLQIIEHANTIIADYMAQGFTMTLRQIYYQFIARDLFPEDRTFSWNGTKWVRDPNGVKNAMPNYNYLGETLNNARLAGYIDWKAMEDRTRNLEKPAAWDSPSDIISACAHSYAIDKWQGQEFRPEVWIEKEALVGVIEGVCREENIAYFCCRGYTSQSEMWQHGQRYSSIVAQDQIPLLIHLGDHDPSGMDMTRDISERIGMFMRYKKGGWPIKRVALNMDQITKYNPPPNPAKTTDSRYKEYEQEFGDESWELDALEPRVIADLIRKVVVKHRDKKLWAAKVEEENNGKARLETLAANERYHVEDEDAEE